MFIRQIRKFKESFSLLHLFGLRPRVYHTLTNFRGGEQAPPPPLNTLMLIGPTQGQIACIPTFNEK